MTDLSQVTKSLGDIVLSASENDDQGKLDVPVIPANSAELVQPAAVLETFSSALLESRDPVMREAFLEACLDVLKPQGDSSDKGRVGLQLSGALTVARGPPRLRLDVHPLLPTPHD